MKAVRSVIVTIVVSLLVTAVIAGTANAERFTLHLNASGPTYYEFPPINENLAQLKITVLDVNPDAQIAITVLLDDNIIGYHTFSSGTSHTFYINPPSPGVLKLGISHSGTTDVTVTMEITAYAGG